MPGALRQSRDKRDVKAARAQSAGHDKGPQRAHLSLVYAADEPRATPNAARPPRVLLVEDDFLIASEIETALRDAGFDVIGIAASADVAVSMASAGHPELVIMDVRLAGSRDGIDAALELYGRQGLRSLFATAHADPATKARAQPAAPLGWMSKPYDIDELVEQVRAAIAELRR